MNIVTQGMIYPASKPEIFEGDFLFKVCYMNKCIPVMAKDFNDAFIKLVLTTAGIKEENIKYAIGYINDQKKPELFFAYEGTVHNPKSTEYLFKIDVGGRVFSEPARQDAMLISNHTKRVEELGAAGLFIAKNYFVNSFMLRCWPVPEMVEAIIAKGTTNGILADFRNIPNSEKWVADFKRLNWQTIWYQDAAGVRKGIGRPKGQTTW